MSASLLSLSGCLKKYSIGMKAKIIKKKRQNETTSRGSS